MSEPAVTRQMHGHVAVLTIDRPQRRNALNLEDRLELLQALENAEATARAIVLTGAPPMFCAGGDIRTMSQDPETAGTRLGVLNAIARQLIHSKVPLVAAVEGGAFGMGLALMSACDFVIASSESSFATSFAKIGLGPDNGMSYSLSARIGSSLTKRLLLTSRNIEADEALTCGLVDELVESGTTLARAIEVATGLAALSAPMVAGLRQLMASPDQSLEGMLEREADLQTRLLGTPEFAEGRAAFFERRKPEFILEPASN